MVDGVKAVRSRGAACCDQPCPGRTRISSGRSRPADDDGIVDHHDQQRFMSAPHRGEGELASAKLINHKRQAHTGNDPLLATRTIDGDGRRLDQTDFQISRDDVSSNGFMMYSLAPALGARARCCATRSRWCRKPHWADRRGMRRRVGRNHSRPSPACSRRAGWRRAARRADFSALSPPRLRRSGNPALPGCGERLFE